MSSEEPHHHTITFPVPSIATTSPAEQTNKCFNCQREQVHLFHHKSKFIYFVYCSLSFEECCAPGLHERTVGMIQRDEGAVDFGSTLRPN